MDRNDAVLATTGFDQPLSDWATLAVDVISEWQIGDGALKLPACHEPLFLRAFPGGREVECCYCCCTCCGLRTKKPSAHTTSSSTFARSNVPMV